ncbi:MAG TPA: DUF455 family protein [Sandaracinaceae bacterium LLY-WYZ-13_1]|nr:DUF455 family protein [Sandaracinaceae bacterium LLY-WYZ-13_1]
MTGRDVPSPPPRGTVERWAWDYVASADLSHKLAPPPRPDRWEPAPPARRPSAPGRPAALRPAARAAKTPKPGALVDPAKRARLLHTFFHHELQAAELMCWAALAFPEAPLAFRRGLLRICDDEIRHMRLYAAHLDTLRHPVGSFGVRDWFWERVPACRRPVDFVALLGIGFEGANLDHSARFAKLFRDAGDEAGAALQERVGAEEIPHVRFAVRWFTRWAGPLELERWLEVLPPPLTPIVMRGRPIQRAARRAAGMDDAFVDALRDYPGRYGPS